MREGAHRRLGGGALVTIVALAATVVGLLVLAARAPSGPGLLIEAREPPPGVDEIRVHVGGEVLRPGVVTMAPGERVIEAVERAGGFTSAADGDALNLARRVLDGEQIVVPRRGEGVTLLDVNSASASELEALPGIGAVYASRLVEARATGGAFASTDALVERDVLPPRVYEAVRDLITAR